MKSTQTNNIFLGFVNSKLTGALRWSLISMFITMFLSNINYAQADFDLALRIYPTVETPVLPGETAEFTIEIVNQGDIAAKNIKIVDYIPTGLEFITTGNAGWSSVGTRAITTYTNVIPAGETGFLSLNLRLKSTATPSNIYNYAEIALSQNEVGDDTTFDDIDSEADSQNNNDYGAKAFTFTDDFLNGDGTLDEDDHDVALLIICTQNACNDNVNISLNQSCDIEILADMIIENPAYPDGAYTVVLEDEDGNILPSNMVSGEHVGMTLKVTAFIEGCEESACWGNATIEDKYAIELFCQVDTVECGFDTPEDVGLPLAAGTTYIKLNDNTYNVSGFNGCSDITLTYEDNIEMLPCQSGSPYVARILRDWLAVDGVGNENSCTSVVYIRKGYLSDVIAPADIISDPLECTEYPTLPNGNPDPSFTGWPTGASCANLIVVYEDLRVPSSLCPGVFDILREFTVVDWCNSQDTSFIQKIKIMDNTAPDCTAPSKFTGFTDSDECEGSINVVSPFLYDDCSEVTYTIAYKTLTPFNNNYNNLITTDITGSPFDYTIHDLSAGEYRIAYFAEDACGNVSKCMGFFEIVDNQDPTPVCIIQTTVTLDSNGDASIEALDLNAGSFDNCGIEKYRVRRMEDDCGYQSTLFKSSTNFCCADAGKTVMVQLRVYDKSGNFNDCMVAVTVVDDQIPTILCPADMTFTCSEYDSFYGDIPTSITGLPFANDNCDLDVDYFDTKAFNACGVGIVVRHWSAVDNAGNSAECKQYIEVESDFQFNTSMIQWPADTQVNQCVNDDIDSDATGMPTLPSETCSSFTVDFSDQIVDQSGAGCGIVERTFTITDNCALDPNNNSFSYVQLIEIFENEEPIFAVCEDVVVLTEFGNCSAFYDYVAVASDNCTPENQLVYSYTIDLYDDGTIDEESTGNHIQDIYPTGTHRAVIYSTDQCGNIGTCAYKFTIKDSKFPTPICLPVSVSLDSEGEVEIWASDFNLKSFDNCTDESDLTYSFSTDIDDQVRVYDCSVITNGVIGVVTVEMYVWDEAGNYDFCTVTLTITDTNDICPDAGTITADISGKIMTFNQEDFSSVEIRVEGDAMQEEMEISDNSGDYMFGSLSLYDNYTVIPSKNDDALNGVTTLDIVQIQKHILGLAIFEDQDKIIAADVNNSASITGADIIQLRRLILGLYDNDVLPNSNSWRFIPAGFSWNASFPYEFPEEITFDNLLTSQKEAMFYGIKVGDVNGSALVNLQDQSTEVRSNAEVFMIEDQKLLEGEEISIPMRIKNGQNIEGTQFGLTTSNDDIEIVGLESPILDLTEDNYSIIDGEIYISWNQLSGVDVEANDIVFILQVKSHKQGDLTANDLQIIEGFETEIFNERGQVAKVELEITNRSTTVKATQLVQNEPNPFSNYTVVPFELMNRTHVEYSLFTVDGTLVQTKVSSYEAGTHQLEFQAEDFPVNGVYYLTIETDKWSSAIKMMKVE